MRDNIKTKEYFDEYILKMLNGVKRFEDNIAAGEYKEDRILSVKDYILQKKMGIIIAKYSRGDSIEEIKREFETIIGLFCEAWDDTVYDSNISFASLSYLLGIESDKIDLIRNKLKKSKIYDPLMEYILTGDKSNLDENQLSFPRSYKKIIKAINDEDKEALLKYLRGWYKNHLRSAWYGTHESKTPYVYYIAKRLGFSDDDLKNEQYYPYDLVHFTEY